MVRIHAHHVRHMAACLLAAGAVSASVQLDIPPREQWDNNNGYCGECSIQQAALHYGTYISQYRARELIDPTQRQDLWVPDHSGQVFDALRLNYQNWDSSAAQPQYPAYWVWTKAHLQQGHPVIITVFVRGESDSAYDHIIPATGFTSSTTNTYSATDTLVFNDCYASSPYTRTVGSLWATRSGANSGSYEYYVPQNVNYGCAVTGVKDTTGTLLPLSLKLNRWNEPNISQGAMAVTMTATIRVRELTAGSSYALLRYNAYSSVPTSGYLSSAYSALTVFTATNTTHNLTDTFLSDKIVIYRCVPYTTTAPETEMQEPLLVANGRVVLRWASVASSLYTLHRSTNLVSGFSVLTNHVPATPPINVYTDVVTRARTHFWKITKE